MRKNTIRLNESQLRKIVKESVKKVLNEGKPYFQRATQYVPGSTYNDYYGGYEMDLGFDDTTKPRSEYAINDMGKEPSGERYRKLDDLNRQGYHDYPKEDYSSEFEANGYLHNARQSRKEKMENYEKDKNYLRQNKLIALKGGVPKEVLMKLSDETIFSLACDFSRLNRIGN